MKHHFGKNNIGKNIIKGFIILCVGAIILFLALYFLKLPPFKFPCSLMKCGDYGSCSDGKCICKGNWSGKNCTTCKEGFYGPNCEKKWTKGKAGVVNNNNNKDCNFIHQGGNNVSCSSIIPNDWYGYCECGGYKMPGKSGLYTGLDSERKDGTPSNSKDQTLQQGTTCARLCDIDTTSKEFNTSINCPWQSYDLAGTDPPIDMTKNTYHCVNHGVCGNQDCGRGACNTTATSTGGMSDENACKVWCEKQAGGNTIGNCWNPSDSTAFTKCPIGYAFAPKSGKVESDCICYVNQSNSGTTGKNRFCQQQFNNFDNSTNRFTEAKRPYSDYLCHVNSATSDALSCENKPPILNGND